MAALEEAVRRVAELEVVPSGVRVEALRAMLWLQTPTRDPGAGERARLILANGAGGGDAARFEDFESYEAHVRREGESADARKSASSASSACVADVWRGCDAQRHLLDALARRSATIAAAGPPAAAAAADPRMAEARAAWTNATLDAVKSVVAGGARSADPAAVVDALQAAQRASLPGASRESVLETTGALLRSARGAEARELAAALTWHVGENLNFACGEYAWTAEERCTSNAFVHPGTDTSRLGVSALSDETGPGKDASSENQSIGEGASMTAAGRAPALAAAVASLARAALTSPCWMTRLSAVSALATVALRSGEPFRLQCYAALREARGAASPSGSGARAGKGAGGSSGFDACASELDRHVATLDHVYRGGARFRALRDRHGADPGSWPAASLAEVAGRHAVLLELACGACFLPRGAYAPMGGDSRVFADAFAGDRASAARTAAELMVGEAASAARKARAGRRRDGMASSVVAAFRRKKNAGSAAASAAAGAVTKSLGFEPERGFDAFAATTTTSSPFVELAPSQDGSPAGSPVFGSPLASPLSSPSKGAAYDPFAVAALRNAVALDSPRTVVGSEPGAENSTFGDTAAADAGSFAGFDDAGAVSVAPNLDPFAAAAEDATRARGQTVTDPFSAGGLL
jgi:hypothetical protein